MVGTSRQAMALFLYYWQGQSHRSIGRTLGITPQASHALIERARRSLLRRCEDQGVDVSLLVETLCKVPPASRSGVNVGRAMSRQEELLDALQLRMEQRAAELAMYEQWLDSDSHLPTHVKRNGYDQWELRYMQGRRGESLPSMAYRADRAAAACAMNGQPCELGCVGCRKGRCAE